MMRKVILKVLAVIAVVCALSVAGYFVGEQVEVPAVATWTVEESKSRSIKDVPAERAIERQIRALTERDPGAEAVADFQQVDPWFYGVRTKDGWVMPGIPKDSPILTERMFPVRVIAWTGEAAKGDRYAELDRAAVEYASQYNQKADLILSTN